MKTATHLSAVFVAVVGIGCTSGSITVPSPTSPSRMAASGEISTSMSTSSAMATGAFQLVESAAVASTNKSLVGRFDALSDAIGNGGGAITGPPLNLTATVSGRIVALSWTAPASGMPTSYVIEVGATPGASNLAKLNTFSTATTFTGAAPYGTFYVRVRARDNQGDSAPTNEVSITAIPTPNLQFAAPTQLPNGKVGRPYFFPFCGVPLGHGGNCQDTGNPSGGVPPYHFQLDSGVGFPPFGLGLGINGDFGGTPTTRGTRTFRVCAVDLAADTVCQTTTLTIDEDTPCAVPAPPGGLNASVDGNTATVTWDASPGATSYIVEVGMAPGGSELVNTNAGSGTSITGTAATGTYYVRVRAQNACGTSPPSTEIVVRVGGSGPPPGPPPMPPPPPGGSVYGGAFSGTVQIRRIYPTVPTTSCTWQITYTGNVTVRLTEGSNPTGSITVTGTYRYPAGQPTGSVTCPAASGAYQDTQALYISGSDVGASGIRIENVAMGRFLGTLSPNAITGTLRAEYNFGSGIASMSVALQRQ